MGILWYHTHTQQCVCVSSSTGTRMNLHYVSEVERFLWRFREYGVERLSAGGAAQRLAEGMG